MTPRATYKPAPFFLIAYLITWLAWFAAAYFSYQDGTEGLQSLLMLAGLSGPLVATLIMFWRTGSRELWRDYRDRLVNLKRIDMRTLPIILFIFP